MTRSIELDPPAFAGQHEGREVQLFLLRNRHGMVAGICNYGSRLLQLLVPDRAGRLTDVALGYDSLGRLLQGQASMGAFIGRYANRIAHARFELEGRSIALSANRGGHCLHGGAKGSRFRVFDAIQRSPDTVDMHYRFADGEEGFPGQLDLEVHYAVRDDNALEIRFEALGDQTTVANFTSHAFFNLAGHDQGDILGHELTLNASRYTVVDAGLIPTGEIAPVTGTPLDFTRPTAVGARIAADHPVMGSIGGYDHNLVIDSAPGQLALHARLREPRSERVMEVWSTQPGLQLFSGQLFNQQIPLDQGKGGVLYRRYAGIAFEPQHFPDSVHHAHFPSTLLPAGERLQGVIEYRFPT